MTRGGFPGATPQSQQPQGNAQAQNPFGDNPFGKIFEEMLGGGARQQSAPQPEPKQPDASATPPTSPDNPYKDIFGQMFETGRKTSEQYQKGVESIFDQYLRGMDRTK
jgi:hypothetical protein